MRILALGGLEHVADRFLEDAERVLREVGPLAASTCSGRHRRSMTEATD